MVFLGFVGYPIKCFSFCAACINFNEISKNILFLTWNKCCVSCNERVFNVNILRSFSYKKIRKYS